MNWRRRLGTSALFATLLIPAVHAQSPKALWVLQEPDQIVEYDLDRLSPRRTLKVPRRVVEHPEYLSINAKGQMVFVPPKGVEWGSGELASAAGRAWLWDGQKAREWKLEAAKTQGTSAGKPTVTETTRQWFLSAGGESLFSLEQKFEMMTDESGLERSVRSISRVLRTDLAGGGEETIATLAAPGSCRCATGTCSETCPEWSLWAPDGMVDDFFLLTHVTPGQTQSTYHGSRLYQRTGRTWQVKKLAEPVEKPLTARAKGDVLVFAVPDGGCCGWENESNDRTLLLRNGKVSVLYDEFGRYDNRNYDVSFYTADARIAAGYAMLAYTVVSSAPTGSEIRLSSEGKDTPAELARLRKAIAELPAVEIVRLVTQPATAMVIRRAGLVGWLSEHEILVTQDGRLAVHDIRGTKRRDTTIRVRNAADAFLR